MTSSPMPNYGLQFSKSNVDILDTDIDSVFDITAQDHAKRFMKMQISYSSYTHTLLSSQLWGLSKDFSFNIIDSDNDVYSLLSKPFNISSYMGILIHTTGWAAPLSPEGTVDVPPSKHAEKRRIGLAVCVMDNSIGSALSFSDNPNDIIMDPGSATGNLAEAIIAFWEKNKILFQ